MLKLRRILVPIDDTALSDRVLDQALTESHVLAQLQTVSAIR